MAFLVSESQEPECLVPELGAGKPVLGNVLLVTCVTWAKCSPALGLSLLIPKAGLCPVGLVSCFSVVWESVEGGPCSSQPSPGCPWGACSLMPRLLMAVGTGLEKCSNMTQFLP